MKPLYARIIRNSAIAVLIKSSCLNASLDMDLKIVFAT